MHWITILGALLTILCGVIGFVDGVVKKGKFKTTCAYLTFFFAAFTMSYVYNSGSVQALSKRTYESYYPRYWQCCFNHTALFSGQE